MASSFHMYGIENKIYKTKHKQQHRTGWKKIIFNENLNCNQIVRK